MIERTFTMIKPDAVDYTAPITDMIRDAGFVLIGWGEEQLTHERAEEFYAEHKGKDFFDRNIQFITSDIVFVLVWEKENAVVDMRSLCGATDPQQAKPNTIRAIFGSELPKNAIHASDSVESVKREIEFFSKQIRYF